MARLMTTEEFIERAKEVHGDLYNYSLVEYTKSKNPVKIICEIHGVFEQNAHNHLNGYKCPMCRNSNISNAKFKKLDHFIEKSNKIHNNKYDYSKAIYKGMREKLIIICPVHGEFEQTPHDHYRSKGCVKCTLEDKSSKMSKSKEDFITESKIVHGDKYDYSLLEYINSTTNIKLICNDCGEIIEQLPYVNLRGANCPICSNKKVADSNCIATTHPHLIKYFLNVDDSKLYTYNSNKRVKVKCPDCGFIKTSTVCHLVNGGFSCPKCSDGISIPEKFMFNILSQLNIEFEKEKIFSWAKNKRYDFYLPKTNQIFEVHGGFHTSSNKYSDKNVVQTNDKLKRNLAESNGITAYDEIVADVTDYEFLKDNYSLCLSKYFDLSNVDFKEAWMVSQKSIFIEICKLYNLKEMSTLDMAIKFKVTEKTIYKHISNGRKLGLIV